MRFVKSCACRYGRGARLHDIALRSEAGNDQSGVRRRAEEQRGQLRVRSAIAPIFQPKHHSSHKEHEADHGCGAGWKGMGIEDPWDSNDQRSADSHHHQINVAKKPPHRPPFRLDTLNHIKVSESNKNRLELVEWAVFVVHFLNPRLRRFQPFPRSAGAGHGYCLPVLLF